MRSISFLCPPNLVFVLVYLSVRCCRHSTGRGGAANLTPAHAPGVEVVHHHEAPFESAGRGGAGNIRDRSVSREPGSRNPSRDTLGQLWNKVTHPHLHEHTVDPNAIQEASGMEGVE